MTTTLDFFITPTPDVAHSSGVEFLMRSVLMLHAVMPLARVVLTQTQASPRDLHQFQIYTADARAWIDQVEFLTDKTKPSLVRQSEGDEFTYEEWNAIVAFRALILNTHNELAEPTIMSFTLASGSTNVLLNASPSSVVHSSGNIQCNWHSPLPGHLDWIALYLVGSPNPAQLAYEYIPDGQIDGTFVTPTPATPGSYEFRYLIANSYSSVAASNPITVT